MVVPRCHAAEDSTIKLALVGCGGRGTGAVGNALSTTGGPVKLVAMADLFEPRLAGSFKQLSNSILVCVWRRRAPHGIEVVRLSRFLQSVLVHLISPCSSRVPELRGR